MNANFHAAIYAFAAAFLAGTLASLTTRRTASPSSIPLDTASIARDRIPRTLVVFACALAALCLAINFLLR